MVYYGRDHFYSLDSGKTHYTLNEMRKEVDRDIERDREGSRFRVQAAIERLNNYNKPLSFICRHCGQVFVAVGRYQKDIMDQLREGDVVIKGIEKKYYPWGLSDSDSIFKKVSEGNGKVQHYSYISASKSCMDYRKESDSGSYRYSIWDLSKIGLLKASHTQKDSNITKKVIDPSNGKESFCYDAEIIDTIGFSEAFKEYERKYGQVHFISYEEINDVCPICGTKDYKTDMIRADHEVYLFAYENDSGKICWYTITDLLEKNICKRIDPFIEELVEQKKNEFKTKGTTFEAHEKKDSFQLSKYIDALVLCEQGIRVLEEEYWNCFRRYAENKYLYNQKAAFIESSLISSVQERKRDKEKTIDELNRPVKFDDNKLAEYGISEPKSPRKPIEVSVGHPQMPVKQKSNIFTKKKVEQEYEEALQKYEVASKEYERILSDYESKVQHFNAKMEEFKKTVQDLTEKEEIERAKEREILTSEIQELDLILKDPDGSIESEKTELVEYSIQDLLEKELESTEEELQALQDNKNKLLSLGVLYPKYDNLIALTRIQEYLITGRCTVLDGPDGAYNLFETEYRSDLIIKKLDDISDKLEQIKENQYQLYYVVSEIQENQRNLHTLFSNAFTEITDALDDISQKGEKANEHLAEISRNSSLTAYNTAKTAYYTKQNNQIMRIMGILML